MINQQVYFGCDRRHAASRCPTCGHKLDASTKVDIEPKDSPAKPGDFSVCLYCAAILRFGFDMHINEAEEYELEEMFRIQPEQFAILQRLAAAIRMRGRRARRKRYMSN